MYLFQWKSGLSGICAKIRRNPEFAERLTKSCRISPWGGIERRRTIWKNNCSSSRSCYQVGSFSSVQGTWTSGAWNKRSSKVAEKWLKFGILLQQVEISRKKVALIRVNIWANLFLMLLKILYNTCWECVLFCNVLIIYYILSEISKNIQFSAFVNADNKNAVQVACNHCRSIILEKNHALFTSDLPKSLPSMRSKKDLGSVGENFPLSEPLLYFWRVDDIFTFENCGFSNTVGNCKYLICADCEMGPVGFQDLTSKLCYVALERVLHIWFRAWRCLDIVNLALFRYCEIWLSACKMLLSLLLWLDNKFFVGICFNT